MKHGYQLSVAPCTTLHSLFLILRGTLSTECRKPKLCFLSFVFFKYYVALSDVTTGILNRPDPLPYIVKLCPASMLRLDSERDSESSVDEDVRPTSELAPSQRELEAKIQCAATLLAWSQHRDNAQRLSKVHVPKSAAPCVGSYPETIATM